MAFYDTWDDWTKRNLSWTGLKNIAGSAIIKADPTPNNWIVGSALPWYQRNVVEPGASYVTKPWQALTGNASTANKIGNFMNAVNPASWGSQAAGQAIRTRSVGPLKQPYQNNVNQYRNWDSPWGVKGAAEIVADPLTWIGAGAVTGGAEAGIKGATKLATRAGATRTAGALGRVAEGAGKVAKITTAMESHPLASAMHGPQNVERVLAEKAAQKAALRGATATGTMRTPEGLGYKLANAAEDAGTPKGTGKISGIDAGNEHTRIWYAHQKLKELGVPPNDQRWRAETSTWSKYPLKKGETWRGRVETLVEKQEKDYQEMLASKTPSLPEVPVKEPWQMTRDELKDAATRAKATEEAADLSVFGSQEKLKRYNSAQRMAQSMDPNRAAEGSRIVAEMEDALTPTQQDTLFGVGQTHVAEDYAEFLKAANELDITSPEALGKSLRYAVTQVGDAVNPATMTPKQLRAYYQIKTAFEEATAKGWETSLISRHAFEGVAQRFGPEDAAMMLNRFKKAYTALPESVQNPLTETVTTGAPPIVPPGASGELVSGVTPNSLPMSEQAMVWAKTQLTRSKEVARDVKQAVRELTAKQAAAIREGRKVGGDEGWQSIRKKAGEIDKAIPQNPVSKANVDYLRRRIDDYVTNLEKSTGKRQDFRYQHANEALDDLVDNVRPTKSQMDELTKAIPELGDMPKFQDVTLKGALAKTLPKVPGALAREVTSDMRIAQTIVDASNLMRQNIINTVSHPFKTAKGFGKAELSIFGRKDISEAAVKAFETGPTSYRMAFMKNRGKNVPFVSLEGSGVKGAEKVAREEFYEGGWLMHNVPGIKQVTEASERSFSTMGNISRYDKYQAMTDSWAKMYPDIDQAMKVAVETGEELDAALFKNPTRVTKALEQLDNLGEWTNITTGRGNLPKFLQKHAETLNVVMYASRLMAARVGYVPKGIVFSIKNPVIRKEFARELVSLTAFTVGTLYTAKMLGAKVEMDPRSTDFGKIRVGDTRIDLMGGFQPYIRYTAQIITGERKSASGRVYEASRGEGFARFLRSKEAPMVGLIHDMWSGETFIGEDADLSSESLARTAYSKFTPLFVQDVIDAMKQEGPVGAALATPAFFGAGATSYGPEGYATKELRNTVSQKAYGMDWDTLGKTRGVLYQKQLEESDPSLKKVVEEEQRKKLQEAGIPKTDWDRWFTSQNTIKTTTTKQLKDADSLLRASQITPKEFRLRVDEIQSNARFAYDQMDIDPQYTSVRGILNSPTPGAALSDQAYSEYIARVFDSTLTDASGKFDYAKSEQRKQEIKAKYGGEAYAYIQQRLLMDRDDTQSMTALRKARETLKPYWAIEDQAWSAYPQDKEINDQIKMLESTDPDQAAKTLKRYPRIVAVRKRIAQQKKAMRARSPAIEQALVWYR
jgi:hypothetical protein